MQESREDAPALVPRGQEGGALSVREAALGTGRNVRVSGGWGWSWLQPERDAPAV